MIPGIRCGIVFIEPGKPVQNAFVQSVNSVSSGGDFGLIHALPSLLDGEPADFIEGHRIGG